MRFKTQKNSATGQKFQAVAEKIIAANKAEKELANELGIDSWRPGIWSIAGGISSCLFKTPPDSRIWRNVNKSKNEWMPKENTSAGRLLMERFKALPTVERNELNQCIGFGGAPFKCIGFNMLNPDFFGFTVKDEWKFEAPEDCVEITVSEYNELFNSKK